MGKFVSYIRHRFRSFRRLFIEALILRGYNRRIPNVLIIEPTNCCNLACACCPNGNEVHKRKPGMMSRAVFNQVLEHIDVPVKQIYLHMHGEPLLNKDIAYFVRELNKRGIFATIYSNGYQTDIALLGEILENKLVSMAFSMDITDKDFYEQIRIPAKYEKALQSLALINDCFKRHNRRFELKILADHRNVLRLSELSRDLFQKYSQLYKISFGSIFPWPDLFYTGDLDGHLTKKRACCKQIYSGLSICWNGDASVCSFDYDGRCVIGNILQHKYSDLYNSVAARRFRRFHLSGRFHKLEGCSRCLLPKYISGSKVVSKSQYCNMDISQQKVFFEHFTRYCIGKEHEQEANR